MLFRELDFLARDRAYEARQSAHDYERRVSLLRKLSAFQRPVPIRVTTQNDNGFGFARAVVLNEKVRRSGE